MSDDFPCVNSILIERHLAEQEAMEYDNEFLEVKDYLYQCPACMSLHTDIEYATNCCGQEPTETDGYWCSYCEECSESYDEINAHDHRPYGDEE